MRLFAMACLIAATGVVHAQNEIPIGKNAQEIVGMGHPAWVKWFCDPSRGGEGNRISAERIYSLAQFEVNERNLRTRPRTEQLDSNKLRSLFADTAKSAFGVGIQKTGDCGWGLKIAESSTAIELARYDLIMDRKPEKLTSVEDLKQEQAKFATYAGTEAEAGRLIFLTQEIEKATSGRSTNGQSRLRQFAVEMLRLAQHKPSQTRLTQKNGGNVNPSLL
jgi:hypothetical protein